MSDVTSRIAGLSPEKRALFERRLAAATRPAPTSRPAIAIIGMGCRLPGADSPAAFWNLMVDQRDAIAAVPAHRWDARALFDTDITAPGKMTTRWGGFLDDVHGFDAEFFGISAPEADRMDPQQRLLLEVTWEALQEAGYPVADLAGRRVGVFVGIHSMSSEYYWRQAANLEVIDAYTSTGAAHSIAANRLSYLLDLRGPSLSVDTACSSSLVALHLACQSLRTDECEMAIVGGVNLLLTPEASVAFSKLGMMAADGRCKTFDARADGFVRSEGCGVVVLRRLDDALEHGDPVMAVLRGSAVNQDGATNGLTSPNGLAQRDVLREALRNSEIAAERITLIETHGTGTLLGDSIEVEALGDVVGRCHDNAAPCLLGAVKTNIGHLEAAAGIAGVIKAVLCLRHRYIPANLHFRSLNPHISLAGMRLRLPGDGGEWLPGSMDLRVAAVASFGFGGTNAQVILEEFPRPDEGQRPPTNEGQEWLPLPMSARTPEALRATMQRWQQWLSTDQPRFDPRAVSFTASVRRDHHAFRCLVVGRSAPEWAVELRRVAAGECDRATQGVLQPWPGLVFVYTNDGDPAAACGELYEANAVFRAAIDRCVAELRKYPDSTSGEASIWSSAPSWLRASGSGQPALFAFQYALTELWRDWGVCADAVIGAGGGELATAWAAGVLTFEDAARLSVSTPRLIPRGAAGAPSAAIRSLAHIAGDVRFAPPRLPIASAATGRLCAAGAHVTGLGSYDASDPAHLLDAVRALVDAGCRVFLDVGPPSGIGPTLAQVRGAIACHGLRGDVEAPRALLEALGVLYELGAPIEFRRLLPAAPVAALPPYVWQRKPHTFTAIDRQMTRGHLEPRASTHEAEAASRQARSQEIGGRV